MNTSSHEDPTVTAARVQADAALKVGERAAKASERTASWTFRAAALTSSLTLLGVGITAAVDLSGPKDDNLASSDSCTVKIVDTTLGIDTYDQMAKEGKITIQQRQQLVDDAIDDQVSDRIVDC